MQLFTIGYEGETIPGFIARLQAAGVRLLIDVREKPMSRKPGFSKRVLAAHLAEADIGYEHLAALGTPKEIREDYKHDHNFDKFASRYARVLEPEAEARRRCLELARATPACLLCFEADPATCHRSVLAARLKREEPDLDIINL